MEFDFTYCQELINQRKFQDLEIYTAKHLKSDQNHQIQKLEFLALSQFYLGKLKNAEINYLKILKNNSSSINAIMYLARINNQLGKYENSISFYKAAIELQKNNTSILNEFAIFLSQLLRFEQAVEVFKKILSYDPDNSIIQYNLALALKDNFDHLQSNEFLFKSLDKHPKPYLILNTIGANLYALDDFEQAREYYNKSLKIKPDFIDAIMNLSILEQSSGNFIEAENLLFNILKIEPDNTEIHRLVTLSKKYSSRNDPHLLNMLEISNSLKNERSKMLLNFAIAKAYDDLKDYKLAAQYYIHGNQQRRKEFGNYSFSDEIKIIKNLKKIFSFNFFTKNKNLSSLGENIIFILGMPRSGTSMIEQIISSHSKVKGLGELNFLSESLNDQFSQINLKEFENAINNANKEVFVSIGENYLKKIKRIPKNDEIKIIYTDKNPINFKLIGLIYACLPKAKVIHCKRSAEDTCLSIYKNYFSQDVMPWAYHEVELANYYLEYDSLMNHYSNLIKDFIYTVQYEDLVSSPNEKIKELLQFCGLDFENSCIDFYKNKRHVKTASVSQVREKVHTRSVEGYKHYEVFFSKLFKSLQT